MRILFANEPRLYRQVLSRVLQKLRPQIEVLTAEPAELDHLTLRLTPDLVVCSMLPKIVERRSNAWTLLYPEWTGTALVSMDGNRRVVDDIDFPVFLAMVHQIGDLLARSA